ncbi:MAG: aminoacetone oxidase family FAD-binding enzyme [Lachnospiraceae bacterium]|nr:aminoacetone oxidase family FAD-binding enzyme [Lachnospiraceae bacterium]
MRKKIAVIGGGAAGMMAALQAARAGADVELYERNDRVGKKLLATGNGKCNFSNTEMSVHAYYGSAVSLYDTLFPIFGVKETVDFFSQEGMLIKDRNGYLYPASEQASTVQDILRYALEQSHVSIYTEAKVETIMPLEDGSFQIKVADKKNDARPECYHAVIIACGGKAAPKTGSDGNGFILAKKLGHHVTPVVPALVQLRCKEEFLKSVSGVRSNAELTLFIDEKEKYCVQGELQLTDYGISGIPVFQFSREAAYALLQNRRVTVAINFLSQFTETEYVLFWQNRWKKLEECEHQSGKAEETLEQFLTGIANKKINQLVIRLAGCKPLEKAATLKRAQREKIEKLYRNLIVTVQAANGFEQAQVSAGGVEAGELYADTLESRIVPNLYFAGEIIDMDGICGGYNLQWAWTSGYIAGRAAVGRK